MILSEFGGRDFGGFSRLELLFRSLLLGKCKIPFIRSGLFRIRIWEKRDHKMKYRMTGECSWGLVLCFDDYFCHWPFGGPIMGDLRTLTCRHNSLTIPMKYKKRWDVKLQEPHIWRWRTMKGEEELNLGPEGVYILLVALSRNPPYRKFVEGDSISWLFSRGTALELGALAWFNST